MRWRGMRRSSNVEDRRGSRIGLPIPLPLGGRQAGVGGIGGLILLLFVAWIFGISPLELLSGVEGTYVGPDGMPAEQSPEEEEQAEFVAAVLGDTEDTWTEVFASEGKDYPEPTLVMFTSQVRSACGFASAASGPFYCPLDEKVYIDLAFYDELKRRFAAPGDFAQAYVVAHEVGHHIQNLLGILPELDRARQRLSETDANRLSVRIELQADCFAGVWAHFTERKDLLEEGDIDEALNAAQQIGDDAIQKRMQGYVVPETFNHGTSAQRQSWFRRGYESGALEACDTLSVDQI